MAAKLGAEVNMVVKLGDDIFGHRTLENFKSYGVSTRHVHLTDQALSGVAPITVDKEGNNSIIIVTGANDLLTAQELEAARKDIAATSMLITQLEIPLATTLYAMRVAREEGVINFFNPAPGFADLPDEVFTLADIVCPNETEAELITGIEVNSLDSAEQAGRAIQARGASIVVITMGGSGCLILEGDTSIHFQGHTVEARDTTGAGDCFIGSFAYFYSCGLSLAESAQRANRIAAVSVQHPGTQTSYPDKADLREDIFESL
ncbi:MAG: ribokinase, partial [Lentisphaerae bacterium]|nr:ribokinase [Lentisphaerota bacterium]